MTRTDQFFKACTILPFEEKHDYRDEESVPELVNISKLLDDNRVEDAIQYGRGLIKHFPDIDLIATAVGMLLIQENRVEEVHDILREVLPHSLRKYRLYSMAGSADFNLDRLAEALVWWSRSVIAQCITADYQVHTPFFFMAHAALVVGATESASAYFAMSEAINPSAPRRSVSVQDRLEPLRYQWYARPLYQVVEYVDRTYLRSTE